MTKPKIVHITSVHPANDIRIFHKECRTLAKEGFDTTLIASMDQDCECLVDGVKIVGVRRSRGRFQRVIVTGAKIARAAIRRDMNLYHLHDPELLVLGVLLRILGKRVIFDMHENLPKAVLTKTWIPKVARPIVSSAIGTIERALLAHIPVIFAENSYETDYQWVRDKAVVLNMPPLQELLNITQPENRIPTLVYVGLVSESRGCMQVLYALDYLNSEGVDLSWECVGRVDEEFKARMVSYAASRHLRGIRIRGFMDAKDAWNVMARCHIGIAVLGCEPNYVESYPTKLFEYMAVGIPVIASDFPLYREIVEGERCGICVNPSNPEEIARGLLYLIRHPEESKKMGEAGRRAVREKYNWDIEKTKLLSFYHALLKI